MLTPRHVALAFVLISCSHPAPAPSSRGAVPPPELRDQPNHFVPVEVVMVDGRRPPQPESCRTCPSGECDIRFTRWCAPNQADQRDWWVCAAKRDELRADGCPVRLVVPQTPCTEGKRCEYPRCPGPTDMNFNDIATCQAGVWQVMSED